jgi:hypothetical protein
MMRQAILDSVPDWQLFAQRQQETMFAPGASAAAAQRRREKMLAAIDFMCGSIEHDAPEATQNDKEVCLQLGRIEFANRMQCCHTSTAQDAWLTANTRCVALQLSVFNDCCLMMSAGRRQGTSR